jgi:hypothetical protein
MVYAASRTIKNVYGDWSAFSLKFQKRWRNARNQLLIDFPIDEDTSLRVWSEGWTCSYQSDAPRFFGLLASHLSTVTEFFTSR